MDVDEGELDENEQVKSEKSRRPLTEVELKPRIVLRIRKKCIVEMMSLNLLRSENHLLLEEKKKWE